MSLTKAEASQKNYPWMAVIVSNQEPCFLPQNSKMEKSVMTAPAIRQDNSWLGGRETWEPIKWWAEWGRTRKVPSGLCKTDFHSCLPTGGMNTNTPGQWKSNSDTPASPCLLLADTESSWDWQMLQLTLVQGQDPDAQSLSSLDHCYSDKRAFAKQVSALQASGKDISRLHSHFLIMGSTPKFQQARKASPHMCSERKRSGIFTCKYPVTTIVLSSTEWPGLCGDHVA